MTSQLTALINRLRDLNEKRTSGPWVTKDCHTGEDCWCSCIGNGKDKDYGGDEVSAYGNVKRDDASFIATTANSLPALLKIIEVQQEALEYYAEGWHYQLTDGIEEQEIQKDGSVNLQSGDIELENGEKAREARLKVDEIARELG